MPAKKATFGDKPAAKAAAKKKGGGLAGGEVFAIPLGPLGYCNGIVSRPPHVETGLIHVYLRLEATKTPLPPEALGLPHTWPEAWIGLLTTKSLASGRWTVTGSRPHFDRDAFPVPPTRNELNAGEKPDGPPDVFSIETTLDEPSMTPIDNAPASADEAKRFPTQEVVIAGSSLEKSLVRHFRKMGYTFHDVPITAVAVGPQDIAHWNAHARRVRDAFDPASLRLLPAGSKTDRGAKPGDWFGFPMPGGGFGAAMLMARPDKHLRIFSDVIVMSMRRRWDRWPTLADVAKLRAEDGAVIRQSSFISVRDGRWRGLGSHPNYDAAEWPWPLPWWAPPDDPAQTLIRLHPSASEFLWARVDRKILDLDRQAGGAVSSMSGGDSIAASTYQVLEQIHFKHGPNASPEKGVVTPQRIAAWKQINPAIEAAMARTMRDPDQA